jgi:hypothetical protein
MEHLAALGETRVFLGLADVQRRLFARSATVFHVQGFLEAAFAVFLIKEWKNGRMNE